jgi:hypothetical protein
MERTFLKTVSTVDAVSDMLEEDIYSLRYAIWPQKDYWKKLQTKAYISK